MATTTPNFGWDIPQSTDLVKDGATAIAALGTDIDTSLVDLKGGTTGQILSKNSNTDMDFTWITNDVGDITAVTAGTGITGGGTSGAVTITNDMATTITASGDIIVGTGSGTYDNLPIGTTGQVLTADTTVSPYKVKWAAVTSGGMTLLHTGSMASASTLDITSISQSYKDLIVDVFYFNPPSGSTYLRLRPNNISTSTYYSSPTWGISNTSQADAYIDLGTSISSDGSLADYNSFRLRFVDYTRSYSQSQLIIVDGGFADNTPTRRTTNTSYILEYGSAINQLYFYSGANLQRGTIKVYGVS